MKNVLLVTILMINTIFILASLCVYGKLHNEALDLQEEVKRLEYEVNESEKRCERMTDTCIDILTNERWK